MVETLGVLAHRGGLVVNRPELTVGVVRAVSRPSSLELRLIARRPLDPRTAVERQTDIRAGRSVVEPAARNLLPPYDEGMDLRVAWIDPGGRPRWEYGSTASSSGDRLEGPSVDTTLLLPPLYDRVSVVLAWPEIGFPETIVELPLPDQATVERETVSLWDAPLQVRRPPTVLGYREGEYPVANPAVEAGEVVAGPRVLSRGLDAVVILNRLTVVGSVLSLEIASLARGEQIRAGAKVAVVHGREAVWLKPLSGTSGGGPDVFHSTFEFVLDRPDDGGVTVLVSWPEARLPDVCADLA